MRGGTPRKPVEDREGRVTDEETTPKRWFKKKSCITRRMYKKGNIRKRELNLLPDWGQPSLTTETGQKKRSKREPKKEWGT